MIATFIHGVGDWEHDCSVLNVIIVLKQLAIWVWGKKLQHISCGNNLILGKIKVSYLIAPATRAWADGYLCSGYFMKEIEDRQRNESNLYMTEGGLFLHYVHVSLGL